MVLYTNCNFMQISSVHFTFIFSFTRNRIRWAESMQQPLALVTVCTVEPLPTARQKGWPEAPGECLRNHISAVPGSCRWAVGTWPRHRACWWLSLERWWCTGCDAHRHCGQSLWKGRDTWTVGEGTWGSLSSKTISHPPKKWGSIKQDPLSWRVRDGLGW